MSHQTLSCKRAIVVISFRWSSQMRIKRFLVTIVAKIDKPCLQRFQLEINVEISDLNPRVMCTSKSKKQVTLVATTRLSLD